MKRLIIKATSVLIFLSVLMLSAEETVQPQEQPAQEKEAVQVEEPAKEEPAQEKEDEKQEVKKEEPAKKVEETKQDAVTEKEKKDENDKEKVIEPTSELIVPLESIEEAPPAAPVVEEPPVTPAENTEPAPTPQEQPAKPVEEPKPVTETKPELKPEPKPQADAKKEVPKEEEKKPAKKKKFWKGEIANIGSKEIISPYSSAGISIGMSMMDERYYLTINPKLSLRFNKVGLIFGVHVPLNIQLFNTDITSNQEAFTFRTSDWDEWQDYLKILRYIQVGRSEDKFFFSMGSNFAQTIGHGTILKRYVPNHDSTFSTLSTKVNWYCDYVGFEALLGDVARGNMFGGLVFFKPFSALGGYHAKSVSFGYTFVADRNAPSLLRYEKYYGMPDPNTDPAGWDQLNNTLYGGSRPRRIDANSKNRPIILETEFLHVQGIDFEFKAFKNPFVDLKFFFDYSWFKNDMANGGFTGGFLGRFNLDKDRKHAMRLQLEFRGHADTYLPSFFDTYYDVERIEMMTNVFGKSNFTPDGRSKYWHLTNDGTGDWVFSFYGEFSYTWKTWMSLSLGYEKLPGSFSIFGHFELPDLWILKGMLSYYRRGIGSASDIFSTDNVSTVFRGVLRLQVLPILYINAYVGKHWAFWSADRPRPNDNLEGHFVSSWDWGFDLEFGYEWGKDNGKEKKKKSKKDEDKELLGDDF